MSRSPSRPRKGVHEHPCPTPRPRRRFQGFIYLCPCGAEWVLRRHSDYAGSWLGWEQVER